MSAAAVIRLLRLRFGTPSPDVELLRAYVADSDADAFRALVERHGPMVLRFCRRRLRDDHAADDAFQATFLTLARSAASLRRPEALAAWLYRTALRICDKARAAQVRRRAAEANVTMSQGSDALTDASARELYNALDEELDRLPERHRLPLTLVYWQGLSHAETARRLGLTAAAVHGRLDRGRAKLALRMRRRGFGPDDLRAILVAPLAAMAVPRDLLAATAALAMEPWSKAVPMTVAALAAGATASKLAPAALICVLLAGSGLVMLATGAPWRAGSVSDRSEQPSVAHAPDSRADLQPEVVRTDVFGDPLPVGALARLGTARMRRDVDSPSHLEFLPKGQTLVSARTDRVIQFSDVRTGQTLGELRQEPRFDTFTLAADGKTLATAGFNGVTVWDVASRKQLWAARVEWAGYARPLAVAPDSGTLAYADKDNVIHLWDIGAGQEKRSLVGHNGPIRKLAFTPEGNSLVFTTQGGVRITSLEPGAESRQIAPGSGFLPLSPTGKALASRRSEQINGMFQATLILWDLTTGQEIRRFQGPNIAGAGFSFSADGGTIAAADSETIHLWNTAAGEETLKIQCWGGNNQALAFSPDGRVLASTAAGNEAVIRLWDVATGKPLQPAGHAGVVRTVAFSSDGRSVATGCWLGQEFNIRLWDAATGKLLQVCENDDYVQRVMFLPDGQGVIGASINGAVRQWDTRTGKETRKLQVLPPGLLTFALSPDAQKLIVICPIPPGENDELHKVVTQAWDMRSGNRLSERTSQHRAFPNFNSTHVSPDAALMAEPGNQALNLRDVATGKLRMELELTDLRPGERLNEMVAFSPDGRTVAAVTSPWTRRGTEFVQDDGRVHMWELTSGKPIRRIHGIKNELGAIAFSPDGRTLATAGEGQLHLWDVATGRELLSYRGQDARARFGVLAFSPDGTKLAVGYADSTTLIWDLTPGIRRLSTPTMALDNSTVEKLWSDLADFDAAKGRTALWSLLAIPEQTMPLLAERLKPAQAVDSSHVRRLIAELGAEAFVTWQRATTELASLGEQAEPALRSTLAGELSPEARQRIEQLLDSFGGPVTQPGRLQEIRAIEILEGIASPAARKLLAELAAGDPTARLTREAKASLVRLQRQR